MTKETIIRKLYHNQFISRFFHTLIYCLRRELKDCYSVLDLGCGYSSPLQFCTNVKYSVGVEVFCSYLDISKEQKIHSEYLNKNIEDVEFADNSFDAVIMIDVLEHLEENIATPILQKAEKWAKRKIIVTTPNGFIRQKALDNNKFQAHLSGWDPNKMLKLGYKSYGLAGFKFLRHEIQSNTMGNDLMSSIRFSPKIFWFVVATFSQLITYFFPSVAFEAFYVKKLNNK